MSRYTPPKRKPRVQVGRTVLIPQRPVQPSLPTADCWCRPALSDAPWDCPDCGREYHEPWRHGTRRVTGRKQKDPPPEGEGSDRIS